MDLDPFESLGIVRLRPDADQARLAVGQGAARRLLHRGPGAAAADPAHQGAIGADQRLGAGLGRRGCDRAHHGRQGERLLGADQLGHGLDEPIARAAHSAAR
jgi:hypothetical protein